MTASSWPWVDRVDFDAPGGCWLWLGAKTAGGYGAVWVDGRVVYAHRSMYEYAVGPIPDGSTLDHLCRVHECVNPAHLEAVTHRENVLRGTGPTAVRARQTHCVRGHPLSGENLRIERTGYRRCRACHRDRERNRRARV